MRTLFWRLVEWIVARDQARLKAAFDAALVRSSLAPAMVIDEVKFLRITHEVKPGDRVAHEPSSVCWCRPRVVADEAGGDGVYSGRVVHLNQDDRFDRALARAQEGEGAPSGTSWARVTQRRHSTRVEVHVVPIGDTRRHQHGACWCMPDITPHREKDDLTLVHVHTAADQREASEPDYKEDEVTH